jgi:hypothetical protein
MAMAAEEGGRQEKTAMTIPVCYATLFRIKHCVVQKNEVTNPRERPAAAEEEVSVQLLVEGSRVELKKAGKDWLGCCPSTTMPRRAWW